MLSLFHVLNIFLRETTVFKFKITVLSYLFKINETSVIH